MKVPKALVLISVAAGLLMAVVSLVGIADRSAYSGETPNWRAQAVGQDRVNLFAAFPALLAAACFLLRKNSLAAYLAWLGILLYLVYSYILYSFFVHFGPLFPFYVAILGLSFHAFTGGVVTLDWQRAGNRFANARTGPASLVLGVIAVLFACLWLADIVRALAGGGLPADLDQTGLAVNPVQVLDLAFLLPGTLVTAVALRRRQPLGMVLAVPLLVFFALMGVAIISMMFELARAGFAPAGAQTVVMGAIVAASLATAFQYLRRVG